MPKQNPIRGRGSSDNPANRFSGEYVDYDLDEETGQKPSPDTELFKDHTQTILSKNQSPDIPFTYGLNPYRGCEHGCIYCYARPTHEFLDFSAGKDFESKIVVKYDAAKKLRKRFQSKSWEPQTILMSGVTDPYQPVERKLRITRACLMVFEEFRNPVSVITKNYLVTRDIDLLKKLAEHQAVHVTLSITSLDRELARVMEPRTSQPGRRLQAIEELSKAGIPVGVNVAPIIPGLTDHECVNILEASREAGAEYAGYTIIRLPYGVKDLFSDWLEHHFPERKDKVLNRIRSIREGDLNNSEFGKRFHGEGVFADQIRSLFRIHTERLGFNRARINLNTEGFRPGKGSQLNLF
ncbi:PA0069 family radical SAM protein [Balneolaceae bacterium YR4-1]|uniref:PA0069 family radical SAM protein n=1 Tax=Halalkalibaculum roseum TaxID=2709311 RepID=A0A6M1SVQ3_9BACT|nr:PA0069 family radical SAM protein [Halalkalibaculum roseum]NGP77050.1 PA0069 family radical SAM protein [Halalkalibaculum roseum]